MSASILYKFRSSTTFEALPLPGSAARLFDVKKAIVLAKKLDQAGSMEFDLSVRDATTNEEYADENMLLPRGTRLIVQRLPAARGHGFLSRMARNPYGGGAPVTASHAAAPSNFYNIDSRAHAEDDEFVSSTAAPVHDDEKELAALRAATDAGRGDLRLHVSGAGGGGGFRPPTGGAGRGAGGNNSNSNFVPRQRPNADPELREQEKQPKKRATGIPRTFLNLSAPPATDGTGDGETANVPLLQPNTIGFEELVNRGGGQSENASSSNRLEYALKITAQTVPEYLQCAICHNVVKDAMILPWDAEGRTTCESCIRDALTQNGFRCPLTGQEGVSPDDLLPNLALRKAAVQFVKGVMEKMEEITKQRVDDDEDVDFTQGDSKAALLEGDSGDKEQKQNQNVEKPTTAKPDLESPKNVAPERSSSPANSRGGREPTSSRRDRRRGPPVGYSMGPAGGAALGPREDSYSPRNDSRGGDGRDRDFGGGRGRSRAYGRGDREDNGKDSSSRHHDDAGESNSITSDRDRDRDRNSDRDRFSDRERGSKRPRSGSDYDDPPPEDDRYNSRRNTNDDRSYGRYDDRRGGGDYRSQGYQGRGGGGRGYGGRFDDRGGYRGRGGGRRGGGYRGRGRY
eukprot:scaffold3410_cov158-Amphora_coffeaeformis.AAC.4